MATTLLYGCIRGRSVDVEWALVMDVLNLNLLIINIIINLCIVGNTKNDSTWRHHINPYYY